MSGSVELGAQAVSDLTLIPSKTEVRRVDMVIGTLVFCVGVWLGVRAVQAFRADGGQQFFYQAEFGPALMMACGRGLQNPDVGKVSALEAFLSEQADAVDCADLPATIPMTGLDAFQRASRYLEVSVALTWKVMGVSWSRLAILPGILFGTVAALTYGLFRLALSRPFALLGMVPVFMSTPNLMLTPQIRDYAKGPFLLAVMLMMGLLVVRPGNRGRAVAVSALAGGVVGLGLGFRTDLMIALPPFLLTLAFLVPALSIGARIAAMTAFLVSFAIVASPMLRDYSHGNNIGPVALLGLTTPFDRPLGIQPSVYAFGGQYNDSLIFSIVNSYVIRNGDKPVGVVYGTAEHGRAAMAYIGEIAKVFPADLITRTVAATRAIPRYFLDSSLYAPTWVRSVALLQLYRFRASVSSRLAPLGVSAIAAATIVIGLENTRAALLIVLVMVAFAGASAVQFHERHFYYLQFLPWWAFGVLAQALLRRRAWGSVTVSDLKRVVVLCTTVMVGGGSAIVLSRAHQSQAAARLFDSYATAPRRDLSTLDRDAGPGRTLITAADWLEPLSSNAPWIQTQFLAVEFRDDVCGPGDLPLTIRYQAALPELDFSESVGVTLYKNPPTRTMLFLAAYDRPDGSSRFRGVEVAADRVRCVGRISRVEGLDRTPLLLTTTLTADLRREPLYQRLR
jgi:hypothetical protein